MNFQGKLEKTLLWEAFSVMDKFEIREFSKFIRSPFFNQKPQLVALFDYLKTCRDENAKPDSAQAFPLMFAGQQYDDQKMRLANSDLLAQIEHFWVYREKFDDADRAKIRLAGVYRKRGLGKLFGITLREARTLRERQPFRHAEFFHDLNLIEWEQYQFSASDKRSEAFNLQELSDSLDKAFIARKLRYVCFALSHQAVFKTEYNFGLLDAVLAEVETKNLSALPAVGLYFHCLKFLTSPPEAEAHFSQFRTLLDASNELFPEDELRSLYLLAINFGIKKINESATAYLRETLELYRGALARDLLFENGMISRFAFNNIAGIALRVGELIWAENFIQNYKPRLEKQWREVTASLNLARVAYARKDYGLALQNLQRADYRDLINNLTAKTLQLKIYFENDEFELLESHLTSMKNYIRRQTAMGYHHTNYLNIVKYTRRLMQLDPADETARQTLRERVANEAVLTEREWFLEMLE